MNITEAKVSAQELEKLLVQYAALDGDAGLLLRVLRPLLDGAKEGVLAGPLDRRQVPGSWFFDERELSRFVDLANAYSRFKFAISDGDQPHTLQALEVVRQIRSRISKPPT